MLDLIRPTSGRALVFGIESSADPVAIHRRVGYIPGEFTLYDRLTGKQTLEYFANLRGGVDPRLPGVAHRALRARPEPPVPRIQQGQQAEGRRRHRAPAPARDARPRRAHVGPRPARPADVLLDLARDRRRRRDRLPLQPHPQRGREELRSRGDHPRGTPRQGRYRGGAPRPRPSPGRAALQRPGPGRRVRGAARRERGHRRRPRPADARQRGDHPGGPGGGALRAARLRLAASHPWRRRSSPSTAARPSR